jgi:acyl-CoA synthetase (AMP-forming)/AMP-acid ligase II
MLLHEIVDLAATASPSAEALVADGRRLTFAELDRRVRDMSRRLAARTAEGDRVAVVADNTLDAAVALYAVPRCGAVLVPANTRHTPSEIAQVVAGTGPSVLLGTPPQLDRLGEVVDAAERRPRVLSIAGSHPLAEADLTAMLDDDARDGSPVDDDARVATDPGACAWIIHTSGTTGRAKGAMLTHSSLVAAVLNTAIGRPLSDDDVYLFPFPLFHVAAYNVLHAHLRRRPVVLVPKFEVTSLLDTIATEGVTSCSLAPTMISMLLDHPDRSPEALASLRQISYGASAMPLALLRRVLEDIPGVGLAQGYGMTELSGNAVFLGPDEHRRAAQDAPQLLDAAGRPGPLVALRIADDAGEELPSGQVGEILVRGDQVAAGYWQDPDATAESRVGPWLRTGDVGRIDADGYLHVVDRMKDIIISGGENVASREVEDVLGTHPLVAQVSVVGRPDERWGEAVCAVVVPAGDLDARELVEWTRGRLAGFKRPRSVITVDELPANASGKVDKVRVRQLLEAIEAPSELSAAPGP